MSLNTIHDSLPYIDPEPTPSERQAAQALIDTESGTTNPTPTHPSLPPLLPSTLSPLLKAEYTRLESKTLLNAITTAHYEQQPPPSPNTPTPTLKTALTTAYTTQTHLSSRQTSLALLEQYGKNAWLIGNSQLEDLLRGLERELVGRKGEIDEVVVERRNLQEGVGPEIRVLEEEWRRGVGRVLETEVAAEGLRREILERRRGGAR